MSRAEPNCTRHFLKAQIFLDLLLHQFLNLSQFRGAQSAAINSDTIVTHGITDDQSPGKCLLDRVEKKTPARETPRFFPRPLPWPAHAIADPRVRVRGAILFCSLRRQRPPSAPRHITMIISVCHVTRAESSTPIAAGTNPSGQHRTKSARGPNVLIRSPVRLHATSSPRHAPRAVSSRPRQQVRESRMQPSLS